jgi:hypothetical protein
VEDDLAGQRIGLHKGQSASVIIPKR